MRAESIALGINVGSFAGNFIFSAHNLERKRVSKGGGRVSAAGPALREKKLVEKTRFMASKTGVEKKISKYMGTFCAL